jgi:hypothetical protein
MSLFVVDCHSANLHLQGFKTIDGRRAAELTLMDVEVCRPGRTKSDLFRKSSLPV